MRQNQHPYLLNTDAFTSYVTGPKAKYKASPSGDIPIVGLACERLGLVAGLLPSRRKTHHSKEDVAVGI